MFVFSSEECIIYRSNYSIIKEVDSKLATAKELSEKQVAEIEKLRKEGEEAHNTGKHKESVKLLQEALAKLIYNNQAPRN